MCLGQRVGEGKGFFKKRMPVEHKPLQDIWAEIISGRYNTQATNPGVSIMDIEMSPENIY